MLTEGLWRINSSMSVDLDINRVIQEPFASMRVDVVAAFSRCQCTLAWGNFQTQRRIKS